MSVMAKSIGTGDCVVARLLGGLLEQADSAFLMRVFVCCEKFVSKASVVQLAFLV